MGEDGYLGAVGSVEFGHDAADVDFDRWVVVVLAAPVLGSLAWFVIGLRDAERRESFS